jgi:hypothetical protein
MSAFQVATNLRDRDDVKRDWTAWFTCSEQSVKREFAELIRQDKKSRQDNAGASLEANENEKSEDSKAKGKKKKTSVIPASKGIDAIAAIDEDDDD